MPSSRSGCCRPGPADTGRAKVQPQLADLALFRDFHESDRAALSAAGVEMDVTAGTDIISQGEAHDFLFVVLQGRFAVMRDGREIAEIGVGQFCGEMQILNPPHATATVSARMEARVWRITRQQLRSFMERRPQAGRLLMKLLTSTFAARLADA